MAGMHHHSQLFPDEMGVSNIFAQADLELQSSQS
jgi:hypothetical protein